MNIVTAQYITDENNNNRQIKATVSDSDYPVFIPLDPANRHYAAILEWVADGTLTIADAD